MLRIVCLARLLTVRLTYRNDLDNQLFGQFQRCADILGQTPVQASGREHLRELLNRASGGVVFTTMNGLPPNVAATGSRQLRLRFPIEATKTGCQS